MMVSVEASDGEEGIISAGASIQTALRRRCTTQAVNIPSFQKLKTHAKMNLLGNISE